jgi:hypothetical protein
MGDEPVQEGTAGFELRDGNVLVGLVRLLDRARAPARAREPAAEPIPIYGTRRELRRPSEKAAKP